MWVCTVVTNVAIFVVVNEVPKSNVPSSLSLVLPADALANSTTTSALVATCAIWLTFKPEDNADASGIIASICSIERF